ncbi:unnamed protein product [Paramecium octaurelia]|uniref:Transmembrane protein n=1 Tax=Paramecium octaurelia TaxID=43137 RepID=A0A8S1YFF2_PAROT|nr:unnamed protein product [Paramecium octaurelia]
MMVIAGLKENSTIYLFKFYYNSQHNIEQSNFTFQEVFSDFLVAYQYIIILYLNKEIQILSLDYTNIVTLNQQLINKLFKNIQFNPIQIVMNTQLLSSLLFINNINEVIIVSIGQNNIPTPISVIQVNFKIQQINLVNQQLILSYICNNDQNICFKVWNYNNLPKYYYSKSMYSVKFDNNMIIQSDNQYFYVTFSNYTVYIYNPSLPQHMSFYYILELASPIVCTSAIFLMQDNFNSAVLFYNNSFFNLNNFQIFNSSFDGGNPDVYYTKTYPQVIYNYSVVSGINPKSVYQTPNESISYLSNFTTFQNQKQQQIQLTQDNLILRPINQSSEINSIAIQYPISLIIDRQVSDCQCISPQYCYVDQPSRLQISNNTDNYTLITSINNQFFALQNNETIQILNGDLTILSNFSYSYLNFNECLISTSNQNNLYSICYNDISQYWLTFTLNTSGIVSKFNHIQFNQTFQKIQKISCLLDQIFILAMLNNKSQELYWINSFNSSLQQLSVYKNNKSMCQDFDIGLLQSNSFDFQSNTIILFMTNGFQLYYQMMFVSVNSIQLSSIVSYQLQICNQQFGCFLVSEIIYNLLILQTEGHNIILIVSNSNLSFIIKIRVIMEQILGSPVLASVIQTIPNYNLINDGYIVYSEGILMQQFQYFFNDYFVGIYQLANLAELQNPFEPILMLGQFNTTSVQKAMIVNKTNPQNIGIILSFFNNSIYSQAISTWNLTKIVFTSNNEINVSIYCENVYSSGTYNVTFHLPKSFNFNFRRWVYILLSIIVVLLLVFCIKIKQNTKNLEYISEVEL